MEQEVRLLSRVDGWGISFVSRESVLQVLCWIIQIVSVLMLSKPEVMYGRSSWQVDYFNRAPIGHIFCWAVCEESACQDHALGGCLLWKLPLLALAISMTILVNWIMNFVTTYVLCILLYVHIGCTYCIIRWQSVTQLGDSCYPIKLYTLEITIIEGSPGFFKSWSFLKKATTHFIFSWSDLTLALSERKIISPIAAFFLLVLALHPFIIMASNCNHIPKCGAKEEVGHFGNLCQRTCQELDQPHVLCPSCCILPECICKKTYIYHLKQSILGQAM